MPHKQHGALLICHGLADDNVHPQNTFEYAEALVQADKDFKEIWYTNRNHGILEVIPAIICSRADLQLVQAEYAEVDRPVRYQ